MSGAYRDTEARIAEARGIPMEEVLAKFGIEDLRRAGRELVGPCPACGGRDRFGVNPDKGVFNCRGCGANGDQISLTRLILGCDFGPALDALLGARVAEVDPKEQERRRAKARVAEEKRQREAAQYREWAIKDGRAIWSRAVAGERIPEVMAYLEARGIRINALPPTIRFLADHPYVKKLGGELVTLHRGPCMIAAVTDPANRVVAAHQTWIDPKRPGQKALIRRDGIDHPAKLVRGSKKGAAIRLTSAKGRETLIMGEGIETTFSALVAGAYPQAAYWAGVDLGNLAGRMDRASGRWSGVPDMTDTEAFVPPPWIRRLIFVMDGDSHPQSTRAKLTSGLRRAMAVVPGLTGEIVEAESGKDLNDMLRESEEDGEED